MHFGRTFTNESSLQLFRKVRFLRIRCGLGLASPLETTTALYVARAGASAEGSCYPTELQSVDFGTM